MPRPPLPPAFDKPTTDAYLIGMVTHGNVAAARFDVLRSYPDLTLRFQVSVDARNPKHQYRVAVMERADVPKLISALGELAKTAQVRGPDQDKPTSPVEYRFGSLALGLSPAGAPESVFLIAGDKNPVKIVLPLQDLGRIEKIVKQSEAKIRELEWEAERWRKTRP